MMSEQGTYFKNCTFYDSRRDGLMAKFKRIVALSFITIAANLIWWVPTIAYIKDGMPWFAWSGALIVAALLIFFLIWSLETLKVR